MTKLTINEVLKFYKQGWMGLEEAAAELLSIDPVRFQRSSVNARSFIVLN